MARAEYGKRFVAVAETGAGISSIFLALVSGGIAPAVIFTALGLGAIYDARKRWKGKNKE